MQVKWVGAAPPVKVEKLGYAFFIVDAMGFNHLTFPDKPGAVFFGCSGIDVYDEKGKHIRIDPDPENDPRLWALGEEILKELRR